jgi:tetratricopeptide (TPR) repeat protein
MRRYEGTDKPIGEIARELDVQAVVEGSLFRKGDSLEITTRLYDRAEKEIWNGSYDGNLPNATVLYRAFARAIAGRIRTKLSPTAEVELARTTTVNPAVYEAYLRGMYLLHQPGRLPEDVGDALQHFNQAIEADPADPLAYSGAAAAYVTMGHGPAPPPDVWSLARANAERALRLDSTLAEVWSAMAQIKYYYEWDWDGADRAFRRANELNPSLPQNHYHYAWYLHTVGRTREALAEHEKARELDPLTPVYTVWIAGLFGGMGDHERAIAEAKKALERYPDHPISLFSLGTSAAALGRYDEAIDAHERMVSRNPRWRSALGVTYARAGRADDARRIVRELEASPPNSWTALGLAELHVALGNPDAALNWLEYQPPHAWFMGIARNPLFEPLHGNPRFDALLKRINLPQGRD